MINVSFLFLCCLSPTLEVSATILILFCFFQYSVLNAGCVLYLSVTAGLKMKVKKCKISKNIENCKKKPVNETGKKYLSMGV